jgi:nitrogen-specific signal transduction histidine kinase/transcriptional regulator with GAF, ATPase, and Fis domain
METRTHTSIQEESAIVERVARIVSSVRGAKSNYTLLAAELEQAIPFDIFGIVLLRHDREAVRVTVCQREANSWVAKYHQHPLSGSMLEQVLAVPRLVVNNYPNGLDGPPAVSGDALTGSPQLYSTLIAPLLVEDRVLGALELGSSVPDTYSDETLQRLVSAVVRVLATAIESVQLGGSAAIQDRQRQVLKDVTSALTSKIDLSTILNQIVVGIANSLNVAAVIMVLDREQERLCLQAQSGMDAASLENVFSHLLIDDNSIICQTLHRRQPLVTQDVAMDEHFPESRVFFTELGIHSIFSYPLVIGTTSFGVLLFCSPEPGGFTPLKADIFSLFASQATIAIHNGMLLESAHRRSRFQEAIEQLEKAHARHVKNVLMAEGETPQSARSSSQMLEKLQQDELEHLAYVREETQRTFGVSFTSLLRFISDHLLTQDERNLQAMLYAYQSERILETNDLASAASTLVGSSPERSLAMRASDQAGAFADTLSLLTQMAETALVRTGMVGELSRLIMQLQLSTNGVKDAWLVVDLNGVCVYMNPAAEALCETRMEDVAVTYGPSLLAATPGQSTGTTIDGIFTKLFPRMRSVEDVQRYLQEFTQGTYYRELRCVLSSQRETVTRDRAAQVESAPSDYHYQLIRHPLCNQDGFLVANALQVCDVTEQVRDEKNRSALLSSVSHDLRTPLTTIKAAVTGLLQSDVAWDEEDRQAMLEDIDAETDHLTVLVNALVELSRIEMGALVLEKEWCDVVEVVDGTLEKMKRVLAERSVRTIAQPVLPLVYADHAQLERVFYHLLENAAGHSPACTEILVRLDAVDGVLRACVIDRGRAIPIHERERLFKSFYSLRSYGNGLGLAICRGIVEAHEGHIWVEAADNTSSPDRSGTCFVFTLPLHPHTNPSTGQEKIAAVNREVSGEKAYSLQRTHIPTEGEG